MREVAAYLVRNRFAAALAASLGAALPLLGFVGGAAAGLQTLCHGLSAGLMTAGLGTALAAGLTWVVGGIPAVGATLVLSSTVPVCLLAWVLRRTVSLSATVIAASLLACAGVALFLWGVGDAAGFWRGVVEAWLAAGSGEGGLSPAERQQVMGRLPFELMTGSVFANVLLLCLASVFLARSGQAHLVNPGGFRREFHALRLGRVALALTAVLLFAGMALSAVPALNLAAVVLAAWLLQGLAVLHCMVASRGLGRSWLVISYVALSVAALLASPVVLVLPLLGAADELVDLRGRLRRAANGRNGRGEDE